MTDYKTKLQFAKKYTESYLFELISDGWVLSIGDYSISSSNGDISNKDIVVSDYYTKRGFNTVKGAMRYIENQ